MKMTQITFRVLLILCNVDWTYDNTNDILEEQNSSVDINKQLVKVQCKKAMWLYELNELQELINIGTLSYKIELF